MLPAPRRGVLLIGAGLLLVALSGCSSEAPATGLAEASHPPLAGADHSVMGRVSDDELNPIDGALVRLLPGAREARTSPEGEFAFVEVAAGSYELHVEKVGFKPRRQKVDVAAGDEPVSVKIQLEPVPIIKARQQTLGLDGFIACSLSYTEPTAFPDEYSVCRNIPETMDKTYLDFPLDEGAQGLLVETIWSESTPLAQNLKVRVQKGPGGGAFTDGAKLGEARGPSVLRVEIPFAAFKEAAAAGTDCLRGCNLTSMTASSPALGTPADAGAALQEDYEQWLTIFYWQEMPQGATAVPAGRLVNR